eukprot:Em0014g980a
METVGRGNARRSGVPCARNPLGTLTSNIWVSLLSRELQQMRQCKYWCQWLHQVDGLPSVGDAPLVQVTLAGLRSELVQPKMCKEPVTADMLRAMVDLVGQKPSLSDVRLLVLCLVAFAGFMHCDELFKLQCSDIAFGTESMTINITSSKTDQYRKGSTLVIARTGTPTYPVAMMERYFSMGGLCTQEHGKVLWTKVVHWLGIIIMRCERTGEDPKGPPAKLLVRQEDLIKGIPNVNLAGNKIITPHVLKYSDTDHVPTFQPQLDKPHQAGKADALTCKDIFLFIFLEPLQQQSGICPVETPPHF